MIQIKLKELIKRIRDIPSEVDFVVRFVKRSDGLVRTMNCQKGVKKDYLKGEPAYKAADYKLMTVFDTDKKEYRVIPLDQNLIGATINSVEYEVIEKYE